MKLKHYLAFLCMAFLILGSYDLLSTTADTSMGSSLVLISANSQEAILELTVADFSNRIGGGGGANLSACDHLSIGPDRYARRSPSTATGRYGGGIFHDGPFRRSFGSPTMKR